MKNKFILRYYDSAIGDEPLKKEFKTVREAKKFIRDNCIWDYRIFYNTGDAQFDDYMNSIEQEY